MPRVHKYRNRNTHYLLTFAFPLRRMRAGAGGNPTISARHLMSTRSEFLLYTAPDGAVKVSVFFRDETAWLTQKALAELFGVGVPSINKHLKNIYETGELSRDGTVSKMGIVRPEASRTVSRSPGLPIRISPA